MLTLLILAPIFLLIALIRLVLSHFRRRRFGYNRSGCHRHFGLGPGILPLLFLISLDRFTHRRF